DTHYAADEFVLEAGCGVGAQTVALATRSPKSRIVAIDISAESLAAARERAAAAGVHNVEFQQADLYALPFSAERFDHAFVCFVLEHMTRPVDVIRGLTQ